MTKTRVQTQRPIAKGRHQKPNTRWSIRENPPRGVNWGGKVWPGTGAGTAIPFATWLFDTGLAAAGILAGEVRVNTVQPSTVTHVFDDVSMWVEYKITAVSSQTGYFDYTVTYTGYSGNYATPPDATPILLTERTTVPGADPAAYDPGDHTIDEVKAHVEGLAMDDQRDDIIQAILNLERANKNRATLVSWLDQQTGVE